MTFFLPERYNLFIKIYQIGGAIGQKLIREQTDKKNASIYWFVTLDHHHHPNCLSIPYQ